MDGHYTLVPKKEKPTFPDPELNDEQYDRPIGPEPQTKSDEIRNAIIGPIQAIFQNPTVRKAGRIMQDRSEVFQRNISRDINGGVDNSPDPFGAKSLRGRKQQDDPFGVGGLFGGK